MKSKRRKRVIASVLCMVLMLSTGMSTLAEADAGTVPAVEETTAAQTTAQETKSTSTDAQTAETETQTQTETENQTETKQTEEAAQTKQEETTAVQPTEEASGGETTPTETEPTTQNTQAELEETKEQKVEAEEDTADVQNVEVDVAGENSADKEIVDETEAFQASYTLLDGSAVFTAKAETNVLPEGTSFQVTKIEKQTEVYQKVEEELLAEADKNKQGLVDFEVYDICFKNSKGEEIEPDGDVQISAEFPEKLDLLGVGKKQNEVSIQHIKEDNTIEEIKSQIKVTNSEVHRLDFTSDEFSLYALTSQGVEEINSSEIENQYATIEFWDRKQTYTDIKFSNAIKQSNRYETKINIYLDDTCVKRYEGYLYGSKDEELHNNDSFEPRTSVWPGEGYYFKKQCVWTKNQSEKNKTTEFTGSGVTGFNANDDYTLDIYLTKEPQTKCTNKITTETRPISVELYNYDSDDYNTYVTGLVGGNKIGALLIRSPWNTTYKYNHYQISNVENNAQNNTCGDKVYYGLAKQQLDQEGNIQFNYQNAFFDEDFNNVVGIKYPDVNFEFKYDSDTNQYTYDSDQNHVHFENNTISQYERIGPSVASDGTDLEKNGFFPFTDENDNMTDYGFGMKLEVEFNLTQDKKIKNENIAFRFSGDDDVWVFIDGKLVLDLGGIHGARNGVIDFVDGVKYNVNQAGEALGYEGINNSTAPSVDNWLKDLNPNETHTLTMYYLERGGDESNCVIEFNLPVTQREGTLVFDKVDENDGRVGDAVFGLYANKEQIANEAPILTAMSADNGEVQFDISNLTTGTYFLKEISAPWGYEANDTVYQVNITENRTGSDANQKILVTGKITKEDSDQEITAIVNTKKEVGGGTTNFTVTKEWDNSASGFEQPVKMTLYSGTEPNGVKVTRKDNPITLSADQEWKYTWNDLPGDTEYYVVEETDGFESHVDYDYQFEINGKLDKTTPCSNTEYELGANGVIAIFGGSNWYVWTSEELSDEAEINLAKELKSKGLNNGGGVDKDSTQFVSGNANIKLQGDTFNITKTGPGRIKLNFQKSQNWSFFYMTTYTKTVNAKVTNSLDTDATIDIPVEKVWNHNGNTVDQETLNEYTVTVTLQAAVDGTDITTEADPDMVLNYENNWKGVYQNLPYYMQQKDGRYKKIEYIVTETKLNDQPISLGERLFGYLYESVEGDPENGFVVTNTYIKPWKIKKVSSTDHELPLGGAGFTLTNKEDSDIIYYGQSYPDGGIGWWENLADKGNALEAVKYIPDGTYILEETKAPVGYQKSTVKWTIVIENFTIKGITDENGNKISPIPINENGSTRALVNTDIYLYENKALYSLPSSGGPGIFLYTIGGVLLLMAGSLILYKMKRGEVLKK